MCNVMQISILIAMMVASMSIWCDDDSMKNATASPIPTVTQDQNGKLQTNNTKTEQSTNTAAPEESTEDIVYKEAMIKLSDAINQKIAEIEAKQKELDNEIYPAYQPPLRAELNALRQQLQELNLQREQLKAQKISNDMTKELQAN